MPQFAYAFLRRRGFRFYALAALLAACAWRCQDILNLLKVQPAGADYSCFWAGVHALTDPHRLYDFRYVTALQGWPLGPLNLRPYIYPPSALPVFAPFAALPYWVGYGAWVVATYALFAWSARRIGAPWWMALFPVVWLVAVCGQVTFLIGGLVMTGLALRNRPLAAGVALGIAAAIKPQMLVFLPLGLMAEGRWRTLVAAGLAALLSAWPRSALGARTFGRTGWRRCPASRQK